MPIVGGTSSGDGRNSVTASSIGWMPLFFRAEPVSTGTNFDWSVPRRRPWRISSVVSASPSRYLWVSVSSASATTSIIFSRHFAASAWSGSGISTTSIFEPRSSRYRIAFISMRSMTPSKRSSLPIGIWIGTGRAPRRSTIMSTQRQKSAPVRSSLLMKQMRGTEYLSAWRQTVSDWGSTPATPSKTTTAPSSTRRLRSTSTVKSTCPGVSMMLILWSFQKQVVAAAVMVMPRSCSCGIQSIVAAPSWTSPSL